MDRVARRQQQITQFVTDHLAWQFRHRAAYGIVDPTHLWPHSVPPRPDPVEMAQTILAMIEFEALALGGLLSTTNGTIILQAVEAVLPPLYREDIELISEVLQIAARAQRSGRQRIAAGFALVGVGLGVLAFYGALGSE